MESDFPVVDLNSNTLSWAGTIVRVQPIAAELMVALVEAFPKPATFEFLIRRVWGDDDDRLIDPVANLRTRISMLRAAIAPLGFSVDVLHGRGWKLVKSADVTHARVKQSVAHARASK